LNEIKRDPPHPEIFQPDQNQIMPLITPAYPATNSLYNVNVHTRDVMLGYTLTHPLTLSLTLTYLLTYLAEMRAATETLESIIASNGQGWSRLFEPNDFFVKYTNYLMCNIIAVGNDAAGI
jgi:poly(A) polymerase